MQNVLYCPEHLLENLFLFQANLANGKKYEGKNLVGKSMPILLIEPSAIYKRRRDLKLFLEPKKCSQPELEDVKQRLKAIRGHSLAHFDNLITDLTASLALSPYVPHHDTFLKAHS